MPRVPEPSSREYTEMSPLGTLLVWLELAPAFCLEEFDGAHPTRDNIPTIRTHTTVITACFFMISLSRHGHPN